jgi:hypothetical protein
MIKVTLAKLLTAKTAVAAAATAAVAVGGVATVATTTGLSHSGAAGGAAPVSSSASAASTSATGKPSAAHDSGTPEHHEPGATPAPSLVGLCHAYTAGAGSEHGKALENPAFTFLITTAGGKDKVDAYCGNLLAGDQNLGKSGNNGNNTGHDEGSNGPDNREAATPAPGNGQTHATQAPGAHAAQPTHPGH